MESISPLLIMAVVIAALYFIMIRPQQKKAKGHRKLVEELKVGDLVMTMGGIVGKINGLSDEAVLLEVEKGASMTIARQAVSRTIDEETAKKMVVSESSNMKQESVDG